MAAARPPAAMARAQAGAQLADELGFAVLAPEQKAANNPNTCFDWFNPEDITRGEGECASIAAMIRTWSQTHRLDARRVFITGLSAGGAMTAAMLATYPELFAGGAIIAGLPFGAAANVRDALEAMRSAPLQDAAAMGRCGARGIRLHRSWPKISIWHGALDTTVNINNAQASAAQWADVHGLALTRRQTGDDGRRHPPVLGRPAGGLYPSGAGSWHAHRFPAMWGRPRLSFWTWEFPPAAASPSSGVWCVSRVSSPPVPKPCAANRAGARLRHLRRPPVERVYPAANRGGGCTHSDMPQASTPARRKA